MKKFIFFARVYTWLLVIFPVSSSAQDLDLYPNYVVIGAFEHKKNAIFFTDDANQHNFPARFEMNRNRNLYYVYVLTTDDREYAFAEALKLRTDTKYFDTWVYSGPFDDASLADSDSQDGDFNPATGEQILPFELQQTKKGSGGSDRSGSSTNQKRNTGVPNNRRVNSNDTNEQARSRTDDQSVTSIASEKSSDRQGNADRAVNENQTLASGPTLGSNNNRLENTNSEQSKTGQINRGEAISSNQPGNNVNEKQKQVTITKADGTTVLVPTKHGSAVTNEPKRLSANSPDQLKDETASTGNARVGNASNSALATTQDKRVGVANNTRDGIDGKPVESEKKGSELANVRDAGTANNPLNSPVQEQAPANNDPEALDGQSVNTDGSPVNPDKKSNPMPVGPPPKQVSTEPLSAEEVTGKNFYFYLFRADNHDMVGGEVDAIDFERSRRMATYPANSQVKVIMPSGKSKQISFLCQVFGYRKLQKEFDPANPAEDMYLDDKGNVVVPFELMRLQKGDIAIMYNVFFFKDAAVMRPESRYEVNNLLELLQENPSYKIRIHGHTNGNAPGKIIYMDKPGNFYSLSNTRQGGGSAKKLSEERALVIREYLISSGISADRMQVEAWGGKKPIHDKNSARAHENVRVEIEILSD